MNSGNDRLEAGILHPGYLVLRPLEQQLRSEVSRWEQELDRDGLVVDVGCGKQPYKALFEQSGHSYLGIDIRSEDGVDILGQTSKLPIESESVDLVLSTQVIEHIEEPKSFLEEVQRVLRPNGRLLLSTHGTFIYHPGPEDYWRWTHAGLKTELREAGLEPLRIHPSGGSGATMCYLGSTLLSIYCSEKRLLTPVRILGVPILNLLGRVIDSLPRDDASNASHSLVANYLAVGRRPP